MYIQSYTSFLSISCASIAVQCILLLRPHPSFTLLSLIHCLCTFRLPSSSSPQISWASAQLCRSLCVPFFVLGRCTAWFFGSHGRLYVSVNALGDFRCGLDYPCPCNARSTKVRILCRPLGEQNGEMHVCPDPTKGLTLPRVGRPGASEFKNPQ